MALNIVKREIDHRGSSTWKVFFQQASNQFLKINVEELIWLGKANGKGRFSLEPDKMNDDAISGRCRQDENNSLMGKIYSD